MIDLLLENANVLTMNPAQPTASTVAVAQGRIVAVGTREELAGLRSQAQRVLDLDGATLIPGLIDAHTHFVMGSESLGRVRLAGVATMAEMQRRVAEKVAAAPAGSWITGRGWDDTKRTDVIALPTAADL
ncbi:MAG: amidohydrolase family protein, partial [Thermomicrobiales bacterium]|nr:amidohydrolase family protein [Thermomicrobiales bacterium]